MNTRNYQKEMDALVADFSQNDTKTLLLHSCCGPCSSYVLTYLSSYFEIKLLYYNPCIAPKEEYLKRASEQKRIIEELRKSGRLKNKVTLIEDGINGYDEENKRYYELVRGLEQEPECGKRCDVCYRMRLEEAARAAVSLGADYFATTLTISPLKHPDIINPIGEDVEKCICGESGPKYLASDFKKKGGYQESIRLSKEFELYRQDYCGCVFSLRDRQSGEE